MKTTIVMLGLIPLLMLAPTLSFAKATNASDYQYDKGYVQGSNKLPMSSTNKDYIDGYKNATADNFGINVKIPAYNLKDFYLGIRAGSNNTDKWMNPIIQTHILIVVHQVIIL